MKKKFKYILLLVIAVLVVWIFYGLWKNSRPKKVEYDYHTAERIDIQNTTLATGKINPRDEVDIKPQISGIISELRKEEGDRVRSGEVIAVIKVIPDMATLNDAESSVKIAQITLNELQREHERMARLYEKELISTDEMQKSEAEFRRAAEQLERAQDNLDIVRDGILKKNSQASNTQIRSTIDGIILDIPVKVGNSVIHANTLNDGTTIATVANMNELIFIGNVDETEVGSIDVGTPVKIRIGAIQDVELDGYLEYIAPKGKEENGTIMFEVRSPVTVPDSVNIRAGYSANAEIVLARREQALYVPETAITFENDSTFVWVVKDTVSMELEKRHVKTGITDGINMEVVSGIEEGERFRGREKTE